MTFFGPFFMDEKKKGEKKKTEAQINEVTCTATKGHMCAVESKKGQKEEKREAWREDGLKKRL